MKKFNLILVALALFVSKAHAAPKDETIVLSQFTKIVAYMVPGKGVRFTLPFLINEEDEYAPFSRVITHPSFEYYRPDVGNSFNVWLPYNQPTNVTGNLFFNIAGYEVTIELRGTSDIEKHVSNYNFVLANEKREELIQSAIKRRTLALETEYKEKFATIETIAESKALAMVGDLAQNRPLVKNVKEERSVTLPNGDKLVAYVDNTQVFGKYMVIPFEMELRSNKAGAAIQSIKLFAKAIDSEKEMRQIGAIANHPKRIEPGEVLNGVVTAYAKDINPETRLSLQILVENETVEILW